ncbi:MAG: RagB/SusD family nutrient uptake outer membrane protein [Tannerellaceae bacterium]|nr:RagB/SusD family nutrient uptake outer membrane protein [Tannerellaceae bacterium]
MKNNIFLCMAVAIIGFTACTDFLHEDSRSTIDPESFYQNAKQAESGVLAIYAGFTGQYGFYKLFPMTELPTDQGRVGYAGDIVLTAMNDFTYDANNTNFSGFWQHCYRTINRANMAIHKIPDVPDLAEEDKNIFIAEARFIRSLFYFNLVRWFGDVPLTTDYTKELENLEIPRDSQEKVYEQIVEDLLFASRYLPESWSQVNTGRIVRVAAQITLAKVYITMAGYPLGQSDKWQAAVTILENVLQEPYSDYLFDTIEELWDEANENSREHILSSQFQAGILNNTILPASFSPRSSGILAIQSTGEIAPEMGFYHSFDPADARFELMKTEYPHYTSGQMVQFDIPFCFKYFDTCEGSRGGRNFPILRYADALLLYAEALNETGYGQAKAFRALNAVRNRAGLPDLLPENMDQALFREAVYEERNKELCFEGHRWFDLKRTGRFVETLRAIGKNVDEHHLVFPIPQRELDANPSLVQNDKY